MVGGSSQEAIVFSQRRSDTLTRFPSGQSRRMLATDAPAPAPTPAAPSPAASVRPGDVVLGRVGKHRFWPALVAALDDSQIQLVFFGDHKELTVAACHRDGDMRRRAIRPFSDLPTLSSRERPNASAMYQAAVEEATRWKVSLDGEDGNVLREAVTERRWRFDVLSDAAPSDEADRCCKLDGAVVPHALMRRASALKLPPSGQPVAIRDAPLATFRVLSEASRPLVSSGVNGTGSGGDDHGCCVGDDCDDGGGGDDDDDDDDDADDSRFIRLHAPLEALEYRGFAAHPRIGLAHSCSIEPCGGGLGRHTGAAPAGTADDALIGRHVRVPATEFRKSAEPETHPVQSCTYVGVIVAQRRRKSQLYLEVYFASDHTRCLFSRQQVLLWLDNKRAACEAGAPPIKRPHTATGAEHELVAASESRTLPVRVCLAGMRPILRGEPASMTCEQIVLGIMDELPFMPSI